MRTIRLALGLMLLGGCSASNGPGELDDEADHASVPSFELESGETSCGNASGVSCKQNQYGVTFRNGDGDWVIYKDCWGPKKRGGGDVSVGPGYIARVVLSKNTPDGNHTIIDDEQGPGAVGGVLNAPGYGGLGAFGWHHSRGNPPFTFDWNNAWNMDGRHCAEDNAGFGVSGANVIEGPTVNGNGVGALSVDVLFTDGFTNGSPLMRVRYRYRIYPDVVKMWAVVTEHCDNGNCGNGSLGPAFIKEPKFVVGVNGGAYKRMVMLNDKGQIATNSNSGTAFCAWRDTNPKASTGQCDADHRVRARFDYRDAKPTSADDNGGNCDTSSHPCFNAVMRAYPTAPGGDVSVGGATSFWDGSGIGLDAWAVAAKSRQAVNSFDSASGDAKWACYGGDPTAQTERRWELAGGAKNSAGEYQLASFLFTAWEGGTGGYDCEPLARRFGPDGESFAIHAEYAVNSGWQLQ